MQKALIDKLRYVSCRARQTHRYKGTEREDIIQLEENIKTETEGQELSQIEITSNTDSTEDPKAYL